MSALEITRVFTLACALWAGATPSVFAQDAYAPEAEVQPATTFASLPKEIVPGLVQLVSFLQDVNADKETLEAAESFLSFLQQNPEAFSREVSTLSGDELDAYGQSMSLGAKALEALRPVSEALANQQWLKEVDPTLADEIRRECGRRLLDGRDLYREAEAILRDPASFSGSSQSLLDGLTGSVNECVENLAVYAATAANEILRLDEAIGTYQQALEVARAAGDAAEVARLEAAIQEAQQRKEEVEKGSDLEALLQVLMGLAGVVSGVVGVIASAGSCVPCYGEIVAGAAATIDGIKKLDETTEVTSTSPAYREGIVPDNAPTPERIAKEVARIEADGALDYISPANPGGNFLIAKDRANGNLVIVQIEPSARITVNVAEAVASPITRDDLASKDAVSQIVWESVLNLVVKPDSVSLLLAGALNGTPLVASFDQKPVDSQFIVTIDSP
jgi:tetratricopeptide (TPR) repeat protein